MQCMQSPDARGLDEQYRIRSKSKRSIWRPLRATYYERMSQLMGSLLALIQISQAHERVNLIDALMIITAGCVILRPEKFRRIDTA